MKREFWNAYARLSAKTKIVAACHVSNLFGGVLDVPAVVALARKLASPSCAVVLDSVAFAPHRALRVSDWGVDRCAFRRKPSARTAGACRVAEGV